MNEIAKLQPQKVWEIFDAITQVPRPSKHEEKIIRFLVDFAEAHNLDYKVDKVGNVVIRKPASAGHESSPAVVLQSHIDMVCEKNASVEFDFSKDAIRTRIEDGWVKACGTTLGADCGIGMAAELAVLISPEVEHPPIEALFTVDEETGLTGAFNLGDDMLSGSYLINLDSEDEGEIFIGCAGGIDTVATFTYQPQDAPEGMAWYKIEISGLKGGHSGDNINDGLGNSNKIMTRLLLTTMDSTELRLSQMDGGNLRNAIPRESWATVGVPVTDKQKFEAIVESVGAKVADELQYSDAGFKMQLTAIPQPAKVIDRQTQRNMLNAMQAVANGVLAMSRSVKGLVETSTNLASVKFADSNRILVTSSQRSSIESAKDDAVRTVGAAYRLAGAEVVHGDGYPGWAPNPHSPLLSVTVDSYTSLFDKEPVVRAIHAGLECGLFLEKYPHLDMVSFGPTLRGVHSPDERLEIATVELFWRLLLEVLRRI